MTSDDLDDKTDPTVRTIEPVLVIPTAELERAMTNPPEPPTRWADEGEEPGPEDLVLWAIHNRLTSDFPGFYVLRRQWVHKGTLIIDRIAHCHHDIEPLRARVPPGLYRQPHQPGDPFTVEETWF